MSKTNDRRFFPGEITLALAVLACGVLSPCLAMADGVKISGVAARQSLGGREADKATNGDGLDSASGLYKRNDSPQNFWSSGNYSSGQQQWIAFDLSDSEGNATDLAAFSIWNSQQSGYPERRTTGFDMYVVSAADAGTQVFSNVFTAEYTFDFNDSMFTYIGSYAPGTGIPPSVDNTALSINQQFSVNADDTMWVVFTNFNSTGTDSYGKYATLGEVQFFDSLPDLGIGAKVKAGTTFSNNTLRGPENLVSGRGLSTFALADGSTNTVHYFWEQEQTCWQGDTQIDNVKTPGRADLNWLAFDLTDAAGTGVDLLGLNIWNYAFNGFESRDTKDIGLYVITQDEVAELAADEGLDFDTFFAGMTSEILLSLSDKLSITSADVEHELKQSGIHEGVRYAEQEYVGLPGVITDAAWVFMDIQSIYGDGNGLNNRAGLGQVLFVTANSDSAVPEPAAWLLMAVGLGGLVLAKRRKRGQK